MTRVFAAAALAALIAVAPTRAVEPKATTTVDVSSSLPDLDQEKAIQGSAVILSQKEWERLAAAWGIKEPAKVDFSKEILLVGTWRGSAFKFVSDVKDGDLTTELVGDKNIAPGFRYKVMSLDRSTIKSFRGKALEKE